VNGHHEVKLFVVAPEDDEAVALPAGWKPFAARLDHVHKALVVARRWVPDDPVRRAKP
jgi:hypothetical protein